MARVRINDEWYAVLRDELTDGQLADLLSATQYSAEGEVDEDALVALAQEVAVRELPRPAKPVPYAPKPPRRQVRPWPAWALSRLEPPDGISIGAWERAVREVDSWLTIGSSM